MDAGSGLGRGLRAVLLTSLVVVFAQVAHAAGGGYVSPAATVALGLVGMPFAWLLARRAWRAVPLLAILGLSQAAAHVLLTLMSSQPPLGGLRMLHRHDSAVPLGPAIPVPPDATMTGHHLGTSMLLAHVAATIAAALVIAFGERVLWAVLARLLPVRGLPRLALPRTTAALWAPLPLLGATVLSPGGARAPPALSLAGRRSPW